MSDVTHTRNFALIGHGGDGKTTLADSLMMAAGVVNRLGSVEDGTSFMNYLPEEKERRITISSSICSFDVGDHHLVVIDTPGDANFAGELGAALDAVDHAVLVVASGEGVKVGTDRAARLARERGVTLSAVVNKMDHEGSDFDGTAASVEKEVGVRTVRIHLPIGSGTGFRGYVDLIENRAYVYPGDGSGKPEVSDIPAELADAAEEARMAMIEAVAEGDDAMLEKYLEEGELSQEEIEATLRKGVREGALLPLICAAADRNVGGRALLELAVRYLPSPADVAPRAATKGGEAVELSADADAPLAAAIFRSVADRYAGTLSILRVFAGTLRPDTSVLNPRTGNKERISKIVRISGEEVTEVREVGPGQIAALAKLKDAHSGDTLCDEKSPVEVKMSPPPSGVISFAVNAANQGDEDKVFESLNRLVEEDRSLRLQRDERTGEFLLTGLGQLHIEVTLEKLRRMFHVEVALKPPKVPYLETITGRAMNVEGKLKKQSGGRGQFGVCYLSVEPGERGSGVQFLDEIVGGSIPRNFIPAVEKGVRETCEHGVIAGYPLTDLVVHCIDGKHHSVDSSEQAFRTAGSLGIKAAVAEAKSTLLEPVVNVEVAVPDEFVGDIMGNLNSRRGRVAGVDAQGSAQVIRAQVPMAEMLAYASDLTSMTGGKGSFTMEFSHYDEVPAQIREKIVADAKQVESAD
jgi:elongation factor G